MMSKSHLICNGMSVPALLSAVHALKHHSMSGPDIPPAISGALAGLCGYMIPSGSVLELGVSVTAAAACYMIGTLLPDIDNRNSALGRYVHLPVGHRTLTHSIWPVLALALLGLRFWPVAWLALGYVLHLFWDSFSACGVCWFWPLSKYRSYPGGAKVKAHRLLPGLYHAGQASETVFVFVACALCAGVTGFCLFSIYGGLGNVLASRFQPM